MTAHANVTDELIHRLTPLTVAGVDASRAEIDARSAVRLFRKRAGGSTHTSLDTDRAVALVGEICRRVDGLPLAIELAAAMVVGPRSGGRFRHLDDLFELLPRQARRADGAQRSLRAAVAWSDALLSEDERCLLRRLGVFAGGFDLAVINAVLLKHEFSGQYQLLETFRQYATEQLALAVELDAVRDRHAYCFLEIGLRESGATMTGPERPHLEELHRVEDNTRVALERLLHELEAHDRFINRPLDQLHH